MLQKVGATGQTGPNRAKQVQITAWQPVRFKIHRSVKRFVFERGFLEVSYSYCPCAAASMHITRLPCVIASSPMNTPAHASHPPHPAHSTRWQFWIDRGGTFTDIVARRPDGALLTHKLLAKISGQPLRQQARGEIHAAAGCRSDDAHGLGWILRKCSTCPCEARHNNGDYGDYDDYGAAQRFHASLLNLDAHGFDDLGPARNFGTQIVFQILRRAAHRHQTVAADALARVGLLQQAI